MNEISVVCCPPPILPGERGHPERRELLPPGDGRLTGVLRCPRQVWRIQQRGAQARLPYPRQTAASEVHALKIPQPGHPFCLVSPRPRLFRGLSNRRPLSFLSRARANNCVLSHVPSGGVFVFSRAQSPGAAQADQGAVGGQDTDLARRTQRNAQVCIKPSASRPQRGTSARTSSNKTSVA